MTETSATYVSVATDQEPELVNGEFRAVIKRVQFTDSTDPEKAPSTTITLVVEGYDAAAQVAANLARLGAYVRVSVRGHARQLSLWDAGQDDRA